MKVRNPTFAFSDSTPLLWTPAFPELALTANAVSMLMPVVEPYVCRIVDSAHAAGMGPYSAQEARHARAHRQFNEVLVAQCPTYRIEQRWAARVYSFIERRASPALNRAIVAGSEAVAFAAARWVARRAPELFRGADPMAERLFLWHLAEEVEHKAAAIDHFRSNDHRGWQFPAGMLIATAILGVFTVIGTLIGGVRTRRILNPVLWLRLLRWGVGFGMELAMAIVANAAPGHHPDQLVDPPWMIEYLREEIHSPSPERESFGGGVIS